MENTKVPLTGKRTVIYESDSMKFRILEFMARAFNTAREVHVIELMRKKYSIKDNENFYLNITKDVKMFLYNMERLEMIREFTVFFSHCRPLNSDEFRIMAKITRDAADEADGDEPDIINNIFRDICMDNKFIKGLDLFISCIDKIKKCTPTSQGTPQPVHAQDR